MSNEWTCALSVKEECNTSTRVLRSQRGKNEAKEARQGCVLVANGSFGSAESRQGAACPGLGYPAGCLPPRLRASEISNFVLDDLNPRTGSLLVRRLKGSLETAQPLHPHKGEPLLDEVKALKAWLKERQDDGSAFLFNSQKGGRLSRSQIFRIFQDCAEAAGLPEDRRFVHILKHSRASHLVGKMDVALVRQAMGHKSLASSMVYAHVRDEDAAREARRVTMEVF